MYYELGFIILFLKCLISKGINKGSTHAHALTHTHTLLFPRKIRLYVSDFPNTKEPFSKKLHWNLNNLWYRMRIVLKLEISGVIKSCSVLISDKRTC